MKIIKANLPNGKTIIDEEDIVFPNDIYNQNHLRGINSCHVVAKETMYDSFLRVEINIAANITAVCAYSLEDTPLDLKIKDELIFVEEETDGDEYYEPGNIINLDEYVLSLILANIPLKVIKKGKKRPDDGSDYRVLSEEELLEERKNKKDSRWDKLDEIDFE